MFLGCLILINAYIYNVYKNSFYRADLLLHCWCFSTKATSKKSNNFFMSQDPNKIKFKITSWRYNILYDCIKNYKET